MPTTAGRPARTAFFEHGRGETLVLVPGIQGRWEWLRPAVAALARHFRVVTFSLLGEPRTGGRPESFDSYLAQVDAALGSTPCAIICGVSFGGLVAVRYAAERRPRVARLVLVSTPSPGWRPDPKIQRYANSPTSSALEYVANAPGRLLEEVVAAVPGNRERLRAVARYLGSVVANPTSPRRMAARVKSIAGCDFARDARRVEAPTLVVTGEPALDRVVPVAGTREYLGLIRNSVGVTLERTGHLGVITRPGKLADIIYDWSSGQTPRPEAGAKPWPGLDGARANR